MTENMFNVMMSEISKASKKQFITIIILILCLILSNGYWAYTTSLPIEEHTESYELQGSEDANVIYNSQGDVKLNGEGK